MNNHTLTATDVLVQAADAIGDRAAQRDTPSGERSMARAIAAFNDLTGQHLTELHGWQFMVLLKLARSTAGRVHADDYVDAAAYAALAGECALHHAAPHPLAEAAQAMRDLSHITHAKPFFAT